MLTLFKTSSSSRFCSAVVSSRRISFRCAAVACSTGAVTDRYQADRLEALERFAHRWVSDPEAARHLHDGRQAIALLELPLLYQHPDLARQPIRQTLLRYGFQCVGQSCRPSFGGAASTTAANAGLGRPSRSNNNG